MNDEEDHLHRVRRVFRKANQYNGIANIGEIARRYFAMNAFDGVLTIIGMLMGNLSAAHR